MKRRTDYPLWMTIREAAELLRVSENALYANKDRLPIVRVGSAVRVDRDALFKMTRGGAI